MKYEKLKNTLGISIDISESDLARPCGNGFNDIDKRKILLKVAKEKGVEVPEALPTRYCRHFEHLWSIDNKP